MKKVLIVLLICVGGGAGYWLARQNQKLFELPFPKAQLQPGKKEDVQVRKTVAIGMDTWQIREILGPPLARHDWTPREGVKKEMWTYKDRRLHFENGFLKHFEHLKPKT